MKWQLHNKNIDSLKLHRSIQNLLTRCKLHIVHFHLEVLAIWDKRRQFDIQNLKGKIDLECITLLSVIIISSNNVLIFGGSHQYANRPWIELKKTAGWSVRTTRSTKYHTNECRTIWWSARKSIQDHLSTLAHSMPLILYHKELWKSITKHAPHIFMQIANVLNDVNKSRARPKIDII